MYQIKKIKDISKNVTDGVHSTVIDDKNGSSFLLSCKNIKNSKISFSNDDRKISQNTLLSLRKRSKLEYDDILLTSVGTIGEVARVNIKDPNYEFQRSVGLIKPNLDLILSKYLLYALQSNFSQNSIKSSIKGGVQPCLFIDDIKNVEIKLYDLSIQQHIVDSTVIIPSFNLFHQISIFGIFFNVILIKILGNNFFILTKKSFS